MPDRLKPERVPERLMTLWCDQWPILASGVDSALPAAVFAANRVIARSRVASHAGVTTGMTRRAAQGVCPELVVLDHDPDRDGRAFETVVRAVVDMVPRVEVVEPGWLCLVARGPSRYFGGEHAAAQRLVDLVTDVLSSTATPNSTRSNSTRSNSTSSAERETPDGRDSASRNGLVGAIRVGVADGRAISVLAARRARPVELVPPGDSPRFVAPLSVKWLSQIGAATPEFVDLLLRLGLSSLGAFAALDPADVIARFGLDGVSAHRLACGHDPRPPVTTDPPPEWSVVESFADPIAQLATLVFAAKRLADQLAEHLSREGLVCTRLMIEAETDHGERTERVWYRDRGLTSVAMVDRARWQLDAWVSSPGAISAGVVLLRLTPLEVRRDDGVQDRFWGGRSQADIDAARAITRLSAIVGHEAVTVPVWEGGRLPSERYRWVPASVVDLDDASRCAPPTQSGPWPNTLPTPAPACVLAQPVAVEVFDAAGRHVFVGGRGEVSAEPSVLKVGHGRHAIVGWAGPWPLEQRWWSPDRHRRLARFQVVTDDGEAHLLAVEAQSWLLLATY